MRATAVLLIPLCACLAPAQLRDPGTENEIRTVLDSLFNAISARNGDKAVQYVAPDATDFSPGGVTLSLARRLQRPIGVSAATFVRHIRLLTPDSAVAIALWRAPEAKPPEDAGARDIFLVRKDGAWKVVGWRTAYLQSPAVAAPVIEGREPDQNSLTAEERAAGWRSLFDGQSMDGWVTMTGKAELPPSWRIVDGSLVTAPASTVMGLRTRQEFRKFELSFEWMVAAKGNSGVKYHLFATELWANGAGGDGSGFEYQVADDDGDPGAIRDLRQKSGALYGVSPVSRPAARPPGEWNESRIVLTKDRVEHWLNGEKLAEQPVDLLFPSPIALQHHNSEVRFRRLKLKQ